MVPRALLQRDDEAYGMEEAGGRDALRGTRRAPALMWEGLEVR